MVSRDIELKISWRTVELLFVNLPFINRNEISLHYHHSKNNHSDHMENYGKNKIRTNRHLKKRLVHFMNICISRNTTEDNNNSSPSFSFTTKVIDTNFKIQPIFTNILEQLGITKNVFCKHQLRSDNNEKCKGWSNSLIS